MDHRQSTRNRIAIGVDLAVEGWPLGHFLTRDLSCDGIFLETGPLALRANDLVGLTVRLNGQSRNLSAIVVHRSEEGIGAMLAGEDPVYARFVHEAIDKGRARDLPPPAAAARAAATGGRVPAATVRAALEGGLQWARKSRTLVLRLGEHLDLSARELVCQAIELIRSTPTDSLVVDLGDTLRVFDSGIGLLVLLRRRAGHLKNRIRLANCAPRVASRLMRAGIASQFRIA